MRLFFLFVAVPVAAGRGPADPARREARRELGKRKQGAKALAAMTKECRAVLSKNNLDWLLEPFTSYDGVLRGPFGFRLSADELKHPSVHSTDHK